MYDDYRSRSRDGGGYRRSPPRRRDRDEDEYYRSRKDHHHPSRSPQPRRRSPSPTDWDQQGMGRPYASEKSSSRADGSPRRPSGRTAASFAAEGADDYDARFPGPGSRPGASSSFRTFAENGGRQRHAAVDRDNMGHVSDGRPSRDRLRYDDTDPYGDDVPRDVGADEPRSEAAANSRPLAHMEGYDRPGRHFSGRGDGSRDYPVSHNYVGMYDESDDRSANDRPSVRPSSTMILEGLPPDVTEDDIMDGLASVHTVPPFRADSVRVIRLRSNKRGRRIAFVEFFQVSDAAAFLEYHYPSIRFQLAHSRGAGSELVTVGINYSKDRDDDRHEKERERERDNNDWRCPDCSASNYGSRYRCYKCGCDRPDGGRRARDDGYSSASHGTLRLTGETDECPQNSPSQIVLIRELEPSVTEEVLAKGISKLFVEDKNNANNPSPKKDTPNKLKSTAPTANTANLGARPGSLRRVFLMRDRTTNEPLRYGFGEFATLEDAQAAVAKYRATAKFTISSKPVHVAFIHTGVFVPAREPSNPETNRSVFSPTYNPDIYLKYWDDRVYPSILTVSTEPLDSERPPTPENPAADADDGSSKKMKKAKPASAVKAALAMNPQMQMWAKKRAELVGEPRGSRDDADEVMLDGPSLVEQTRSKRSKDRPTASYISYADVDELTCLLCMRKFKSELELRDHEALNEDHQANTAAEDKRSSAIQRLESSGKTTEEIVRRKPRDPSTSAPIYTSYADKENLRCLICQRKFPNPSVLSLHERESEMHRKNMLKQSNIDRAISQLASVGKQPMKMVPTKTGGDQGKQYRDRARERRQAYSQPKKPSGPRGESRKETAKAAEVQDPPKPAAPSKGAALLGKMGWTSGEGLGATGAGRTEAISTDVYAPGVGLGAEGGKLGDAATEAARKTENKYSDFVQQTKDKARERFERLG